MIFRAIAWFLLVTTAISYVHTSASLPTPDAQSKSSEEEGKAEDNAKDESRMASWNGPWSPGSDQSEDGREKRRLGSALNIGRGRDKPVGKREPRDRGYDDSQEVPGGVFGPVGGEADKRNLGSAMNLIKVRKNGELGFVPEREFFDGEQFRNRRRLGSAMNLRKLANNAKSQSPHF